MRKILVVDDESVIRDMVKTRLEANGYEVITAVDGQDALDKARNENPELIILDLMLPKIDGYKVCGLLKSDTRHKNTPIIMFTARAQDSDIQLGKEIGADAYITKPFDSKVLLEKIENLIKK